MPNINIRHDTRDSLSPLRGRGGFGHSYDGVIQELLRHYIATTTNAVMAGDRMLRIEETSIQSRMMLEQILLLLRGKNDGGGDGPPPTMTIS